MAWTAMARNRRVRDDRGCLPVRVPIRRRCSDVGPAVRRGLGTLLTLVALFRVAAVLLVIFDVHESRGLGIVGERRIVVGIGVVRVVRIGVRIRVRERILVGAVVA